MFVKPGDQVSKYTVDVQLGEGGMGSVYRALAPDGRAVALKVMAPDGPRERFQAEAETLSQLHHPGIPEVYEWSLEPFPYLVQEIIEGPSLEKRLEERLSRQEALDVAQSLLSVLALVHDKGFVHRDLTPGNVLLRGEQACLIDFGLVRVLDSADRFTRTGEILGTPQYLAPEQIDPNLGPISPRTDLFAAGTLIYQMLTGQPTTVMASIPRVLRQILKNDPPPMEGVPEALAAACLKALNKNPQERYASAQEFATALQAAV